MGINLRSTEHAVRAMDAAVVSDWRRLIRWAPYWVAACIVWELMPMLADVLTYEAGPVAAIVDGVARVWSDRPYFLVGSALIIGIIVWQRVRPSSSRGLPESPRLH